MVRRRRRRSSDSGSSSEEDEDAYSSSSGPSESSSGGSSTDSYSSSGEDGSSSGSGSGSGSESDSGSSSASDSDSGGRGKKARRRRGSYTSGWRSDDSDATEKKKEDCEKVTKEICKALKEDNVALVSLIVKEFEDSGKTGLKLLAKTKKIERGKGIKTADGERRMSPGGVFLHIAKEALGIEKFKQLCKDANKMKTHQKELAAAIKNKGKKKRNK